MHTFLYELYRKKSSSRETTATLASHMASINDIFKRYNTVNLLPTSSHNYLINTAQLCMQSVHQNSLHYVHTEGLSPVLPYGAMACRRVHLHVCPCSFMYMRWGIWKELLVDFFFFFKSVSHSWNVWPHESTFHSLSPFLSNLLSLSDHRL